MLHIRYTDGCRRLTLRPLSGDQDGEVITPTAARENCADQRRPPVQERDASIDSDCRLGAFIPQLIRIVKLEIALLDRMPSRANRPPSEGPPRGGDCRARAVSPAHRATQGQW